MRVIVDETETEIKLDVISIGNTFDWKIHRNKGVPRMEEKRGRGLFILQEICHSFSYEHNGQVAKMIFMKEGEIGC